MNSPEMRQSLGAIALGAALLVVSLLTTGISPDLTVALRFVAAISAAVGLFVMAARLLGSDRD